jgi:hypothetical protein
VTILHNAEIPYNNGRSKAFLLGLYLGLSLLLFVSYLDPELNSPLHKATNIYAVQALAGAILGFWRIRKRAENSRKTPALASVWICLGLAGWVIGQGLWTWGTFKFATEEPYPWWSDIFYIASDLCWLVALFYIFKSLDRRRLIENGSFITIATTVLGLLVSGFVWVDHKLIIAKMDSSNLSILACDFTYILVTFLSMILAVALVLGEENSKIPFPVHQCIRYLCAATAIDAVAILAFTVTVKLKDPPLAYFNGNWVDWLFLTAMYCWGVSALKCSIRREELQYTSGTRRSGLQEDDIYRASEVAESYSQAAHGTEPRAIYSGSIRWILDTIPRCWRVVKLGDLVVGSTFVFPVPQLLIDAFLDGEMNETKEREMFEEVKKKSPTWECLYLADASIVAKHRRRGLAFKCFRETIENIAEEHNSKIKVYCWPNTLERKGLADKLRSHFEDQGIRVIKVE